MSKSISILDKDYAQWVEDLSVRYSQSQVRASVKVNRELLRYYWELGRDIEEMHVEERWGQGVVKNLSADLQHRNPNATGLSRTNIYYAKKFYLLYSQYLEIVPQVVGRLEVLETSRITKQKPVSEIIRQPVGQLDEGKVSQTVAQLDEILFFYSLGHHRFLMDKYSKEPAKAFYYVRKTMEEGWSRDVMFNHMDAHLYEREGKALTNFKTTLPAVTSELAQELTKDPYDFAFTGITQPYNERILKDALLNNITNFLTELGTGFAYVGKEYRLQVGQTENFIDLLFYNLNLSCYVVIEIGKFEFSDIGQLGGYVVACNHQLRKEGRDNPTIGLLICKEKDRVQAQYALESSSQPLGISEYDLEKYYPEKVEGTIPTIEEIEAKLSEE